MTEKPLFIPLKAVYFDRFASGEKSEELRRWGPRWNMNTCRPGREVVLSRGYGKQRRLRALIGQYTHMPGYKQPAEYHDAIVDCFGSLDADIVRISLVAIGPMPGELTGDSTT